MTNMSKCALIGVLIGIFVLGLFTTGLAEEPEYGGTLAFPIPYGGEPSNLDPAKQDRAVGQMIIQAIAEPLVDLNEETLEVVPALAKSWTLSEDKTTYTFDLKEGVKFHNGREFVARDVKDSFERVLDTAYSSLIQNIVGAKEFQKGETDHVEGIKVINDYKLQIELKEFDAYFLQTLASTHLSIVPREAVEKWGDQFGSHVVGTGPFELEEWRRGSYIKVSAFDDYHKEELPYLDAINFVPMPETTARATSFKAGELDANIVSSARYPQYKKDPEKSKLLIETPELWTRNIGFNMTLEKLQDVRVRKAFNYAIDKELIIEKLLGGKAFVATGWLSKALPSYDPDLKGYPYNPEKAKELMEEAGYSKSNPLKLEILGQDHPAYGIPIVEAITPYLKRVGFEIDTVLVDGATQSDRISGGDFEAYIWSSGGTISGIQYIKDYLWSKLPEGAQYTRYSNPKLDKLLEKASSEPSKEKRIDLAKQANEILVKDPPVWFFNYNKAVLIHKPWAHGFAETPRDMVFQPWEKIWVDSASPRK